MKYHLRWYLPAVVAAMVLFSSFSLAQNYHPLPDTGQTLCYDVAGNVITCPAEGQPLHGQDAQYQGPAPAYQDNGNGTVTDLNTGLMWMKGTADTDNSGTIDGSDRLNWQSAINYCDGLSYAGHGDWRLPGKFELQSIVDYGRYNPSINPVFTSQSSNYWSATTGANKTYYAWHVGFASGGDYWYVKSYDFYVRCVRSGL